MVRITWLCATCSQPFTRRTSATRHDNNKHRGQAEIVPLLEYIVGRGTGRFMHSMPLSYGHHQKWQAHNSISRFGLATVADSVGNRFMSGSGPQEPPRANMYNTIPLLRTAHPDDHLRVQEIGLKIKELKR